MFVFDTLAVLAKGFGLLRMKISVTDRDGISHETDGEEGLKLMEALCQLDYGVAAICGGMCSCGTCHVYVADEWQNKLSPMEPDEDELLDGLEYRAAASRLSCQIELHSGLDGIAVTIAPEE